MRSPKQCIDGLRNAALVGGLLPITLEFAQHVSDVMKEVPPDEDPQPQAKFYS